MREQVIARIPADAVSKEAGPEAVGAVLQRALARAAREFVERTGQAWEEPDPIRVPKPVSEAEALDRVVDMLMEEYERRSGYLPTLTLEKFLDEKTGRMLTRAWQTGRPVDRRLLRQGLEELFRRKQAEKGRRERISAPSLNRKQRRALERARR